MKKLLLILIMLLITGAIYAPGLQRDPLKDIATWLRISAPLCPENLNLAFDINGIIAPVIVMAQARLETGHFRSELCTGHNNLFGMKLARVRPTTALSATEVGYAAYQTWYDSVIDMKLFQEYYLSRGRDLTDYFKFLASIGYAEDPQYLPKVRQLCLPQ